MISLWPVVLPSRSSYRRTTGPKFDKADSRRTGRCALKECGRQSTLEFGWVVHHTPASNGLNQGVRRMQRRRRWATGLLLFLLLPSAAAVAASAGAAVAPTPVDLVIVNGRVVDGTGAEPYAADVVIGGGRILFLGKVDGGSYPPEVVIDAAGRVVAPGFVDPHSHGDPFETPAFENFLAMGVTTISLGQDGSSPDVDDLGAWLAAVDARGIGPNLAMLVGHGTLRQQTGIGLEPQPTRAQLDLLAERLDQALDVTFGLSTGLEYNPGLNAGPAELELLARVVGARGRVIMSHLRNEDDDQLERSLDELIGQGKHARVHVAHLKSVFGRGAERAEAILALIEAARQRGVVISADVYPYTASYTGISLLFPVWAKTTEQFEAARRTRYDELAGYLRGRVMSRNGPEATLLGTAPYTGRTLADLAAALNKPFERVLIDDIGPQGASAAYFVMDEPLQARLLQDPMVAVSSDGHPTGFHPRGHGTFAKIIEDYVVGSDLLTLPEAIRKMTSLPAGLLGIADRGRLQVGMAADVVVFDPAKVRAAATYTEPLKLADGFDLVVVNGHIARRDGALAARTHGRVLQP
jgi:N-acyl-D-amino-acid deacylase